MISKTDTIYAHPLTEIQHFQFDDTVADVFPDMIKRSVPGYSAILSMIGNIAERYVQNNSICYDLGCSLGAATFAMRHHIQAQNCQIISIDNSSAMIERCQKLIKKDNANYSHIPVSLICQPIQTIAIDQASVVVLNFTLQFIPPKDRFGLLQKIYKGMRPNGVLVLSEKVISDNKHHQNLMTELYHNFKRSNGYSDMEIAQKRTALEKILQPETIKAHRQRLLDIGFSSAELWFQCFNFSSMIAMKAGK